MTACVILLWVGAVMLGGCVSSGVKVSQPGKSAVKVTAESEVQLPDGRIFYTIAPLDVLKVDVYPGQSSLKQHKADYANEIQLQLFFNDNRYRIAPGDTLTIEFAGESDKVYDLAVLPDGKIRLPRIGNEVLAVGKTPRQLTALLNQEYTSLLLNPHVLVNVTKSGLDDLQRLSANYTVDSDGQIIMPLLGSFNVLGRDAMQIKSMVFERAKKYFHNNIEVAAAILPGNGQQVTDSNMAADGKTYFHGNVKVSPDGDVFVPGAGIFAAQGKTLDDLNHDMQLAFDQVYQNRVQVHVALEESSSMNVYIGGDVLRPGKYSYQASLTLLQLIISAGWVNESADISKTVLLHATDDNRYVRYQTNLTEVVDGQTILKQDIRVSPKDIVIIPKSDIENVDLWIDQYIRRLLPFGTSVSYTVVKQGSSVGALIK